MPVENELLRAAHDRVLAEAKRRGVRWTGQRRVIVEQFLLAGEHLTADGLLALVREIDPKVGAATVYRTLNLLVEIGIAERVRFDAGSAAFESTLGREHHDHLICVACGAIHEFRDDRIEKIQLRIAAEHGFTLQRHRLELFGLCPACQARV
jgi:Fur family ferric uptake transcriptional regulator